MMRWCICVCDWRFTRKSDGIDRPSLALLYLNALDDGRGWVTYYAEMYGRRSRAHKQQLLGK